MIVASENLILQLKLFKVNKGSEYIENSDL